MSWHEQGLLIEERLLKAIAGERPGSPSLDEQSFQELAMEIFRFQYDYNPIYRHYCNRLGVNPKETRHWLEIPAVPTLAFKESALTVFPVAEARYVFHTSGTTTGRPGRHLLPDEKLYRHAALKGFSLFVTGYEAEFEDYRCMCLFPPPSLLPHSSLGHMMQMVVEKWHRTDGKPMDECFYIDSEGLQSGRLEQDLDQACRCGHPVLLMGTAYSFVHLLDDLQEKDLSFSLPQGSLLMDTGGYKGRSRQVPRSRLLEGYRVRLGLPGDQIVNEYGMTELSSQFYQRGTEQRENRPDSGSPGSKEPAPVWQGSSWARAVIVDPETLKPLPPGRRGLIRVHDLANLWSAAAVQTEDRGREADGGFVLLGRAPRSELRGCSLTVEEYLL